MSPHLRRTPDRSWEGFERDGDWIQSNAPTSSWPCLAHTAPNPAHPPLRAWHTEPPRKVPRCPAAFHLKAHNALPHPGAIGPQNCANWALTKVLAPHSQSIPQASLRGADLGLVCVRSAQPRRQKHGWLHPMRCRSPAMPAPSSTQPGRADWVHRIQGWAPPAGRWPT